jgi:hypothetical protein
MNARLRNVWRVAIPLCVMLLAEGCIKINSMVTVAADGSGVWHLVYAMPTHMIRQAQLVRELSAELEKAGSAAVTNAPAEPVDIPFLFDEAAVRARFAPLEREGLVLSKLQIRSRGDWQYVDLTLKFDSFETLAKQAFLRDCGVSLKRLGDDTFKIVVTLPHGDVETEMPNLADPVVSESLTPFLKGLVVISAIEVPGEIRNSNSAMSDARRATWEWDFEKDSRAVERLLQDKMILVFDSVTLRFREFDKPAGR